MFDYTVTISEAAQYSGIPVRKWFDWMEQGMVPASPGPPENPQRSDYPALAAFPFLPCPDTQLCASVRSGFSTNPSFPSISSVS